MANEKRLVWTDDVMSFLCKRCNEMYSDEPCEPSDCLMLEELEKCPTVDAVEVLHGQWHIDDYDGGEPDGYAAFIEVHCSKCGYELGAESGQYGWAYGDPFPLNYCPNCGADMRERSEGE